jgi:hypothetical protein
MKKANYIAAVIVTIFMFEGLAYGGKGKHPRNIDGNDWTGFSKSYKMGFVSGFYAIHDILMRKSKEINDFIDYVLPDLCPEKFKSQKEELLWLRFKFRFPVEWRTLNWTKLPHSRYAVVLRCFSRITEIEILR